jgi:hypothetical protein
MLHGGMQTMLPVINVQFCLSYSLHMVTTDAMHN